MTAAFITLGAYVSCGSVLSLIPERAMARTDVQQTSERVLVNRIPAHVPLRIGFRAGKEAVFRKLDNEQWVKEFELEIRNTGDKPIYSLEFALELPDMTPAADRTPVFLMHYGRVDLLSFETPLTAADIPIKPGESVVIRVDNNDIEAWEHFRKVGNWQLPKKVNLLFSRLTFGDGTGLDGGDARPWPEPKPPR
jgi:hypothetical protein